MNQPKTIHDLRQRREELRRKRDELIEQAFAAHDEVRRLTKQIESCEALLVAKAPAAF